MSAIPKPEAIPPFERNPLPDRDTERHGRIRLVPFDAPVKLLHRPYVVQDLIYEKTTFLIYGAPQAGKSFAALDLVLSVSGGIPWMGCATDEGLAVYVASEGRDGILMRTAGWKAVHSGTSMLNALHLQGGDFKLLEDAYVDDLIAEVNRLQRDQTISCKLIVIDTLSSAIPGADENNQATMSTVMSHLRRITDKTGAAVGLVHHVPKGNSREPRGNNVLVAGMDTSLLVTDQSGQRVMEVVKQRDGATGKKIYFNLAEQAIPCDGGKIINTCVPILQQGTALRNDKSSNLQGTATALLKLAIDLAPNTDKYRAAAQGDEIVLDLATLKDRAHTSLYADANSEDAKRKRFARDLQRLKDIGKIRSEGKSILIVGSSEIVTSAITGPSPGRASITGQTDGQDTPL
ncbi:helicase RepA family protein [Mesorhizobium sp. CA10]|uniref:AAA family ATPase n=1 Tax=Mesorhizobium sp. CA10 TaxID=588495 RepID=UPI001CCB2B46|nr:AAA family ATPase [Mesorhizobium sp. CA10]MBZ9884804.1 helicase RepA family protein [Mesorhizobium sp. CA10]